MQTKGSVLGSGLSPRNPVAATGYIMCHVCFQGGATTNCRHFGSPCHDLVVQSSSRRHLANPGRASLARNRGKFGR